MKVFFCSDNSNRKVSSRSEGTEKLNLGGRKMRDKTRKIR